MTVRKPASLVFWSLSACLWVLTAIITFLRFKGGLSTVSNMNDSFPWGIWISFDLSAIALSAGGFVLAGAVHLFRLRKFEPVLRATILTAFLGYALASTAVLLDVGRPQRIWHPIIMWQHHSFMFEVAWCIMLYSTILALEFAPVLLEKFGMHDLIRLLKMAALPMVLAGVLLSTLHQSSLGSLYLLVPEKLHPLWFSPLLPVFFLLSAVAGGVSVVIVESLLFFRFYSLQMDLNVLPKLGRAAGFVLVLYGLSRIADLVHRGAWHGTGILDFETVLIFAELGAGVFLPAALFLGAGVHADPRRLIVPASLSLAGVVLNRFNVTWFGLLRYSNFSYIPTWMEVVSTAGLLTAGIAAFVAASRTVPVFEKAPA